MKRILLFILLYSPFVLLAQVKEYPPAESDFFAEVLQELKSPQPDQEDEVEQFKAELNGVWQSGYFTLQAKQEIIKAANGFRKRRFRTFPYFYNYLRTLVSFQKTNAKTTNFTVWHKDLAQHIDNKKNTVESINSFLNFTNKFLKARILFDNKSTTWQSYANDYTIIRDSVLKIKLTRGNLVGRINSSIPDSIIVHEAEGFLMPWEQLWIGSKGKITWERAGWPKEDVYALLGHYQIPLIRVQFNAENVNFSHKKYLQKSVKGRLKERLIVGAHGKKANYPRFESYKKRFDLKSIFTNVNYSGGFSMHGSKFIGSGDKESPAIVDIIRNKKSFMRAEALAFTIYKDHLSANNARTRIAIDKDSITHPSITFKYNDTTKMVSFLRDKEGLEAVEFLNSFHQVRMDVERIQWRMKTDSIFLRSLPGAPSTRNVYSSIDYFNLREFEAMQGHDNQHPLLAINKFANSGGFDIIPVDKFASYIRKPNYQVRQLFTRLAYKGYLEFKEGDEHAIVTDKFEQHLRARRRAILDQIKVHIYRHNRNRVAAEEKFQEYIETNTKDFDIIQVRTNTSAIYPSGILNLKNNALTINGVDSVPLSLRYETQYMRTIDRFGDSIRVKVRKPYPITIRPNDRKIIMNKNRDFYYNGKLKVKDFAFTGRNFQFKYDDFKVNLDSIDYLRLSVFDEDEQDVKNVLHVIENIKGNLLLDSANNKSGTIEAYRYPIFNSQDTSRIYYNDIDIMEIIYPKGSFYLEIYPYTIPSLFSFTADRWRQRGYFRSGGIVPDFEDMFIIRKDTTEKFGSEETHYSFGFQKKINPKGMPAYGGPPVGGVLYQELNLSMKGLIGNGRLDYASSTMRSSDFIFTPDSMVAYTTNFKINRDQPADVPNVFTEESDVVWKPYKNTLDAKGIGAPFYMYDDVMRDDTVTFVGKMTVKPDSLYGDGSLHFVNAQMDAKDFIFQGDHYKSESVKFALTTPGVEKPIFETNNIKADVRLADKAGSFKGNNNSFVEFPSNQYICYMDQFDWDFYDNQIEFTSTREYTDISDSLGTDKALLVGSRFISQHPDQDSLSFISAHSNFDPIKKVITAHEVKLIRAADATIYPSTPVTVFENAVIDTLYETTIVAPTKERYHTLFDATAKIEGRFDYFGKGNYEYIDEKETTQTVHFDTIRVNDLGQTVGHGYVHEDSTLLLSENFSFFGDMNLSSPDSLLTFDGFTELRHNSTTESPWTWVKFKTRIYPRDIKIPIEEKPRSKNTTEKGFIRSREDIFAGFMITRDSAHVYTNFLSRKKNRLNKPILSALPKAREELQYTTISAEDKKDKKKEEEKDKNTTATADSTQNLARKSVLGGDSIISANVQASDTTKVLVDNTLPPDSVIQQAVGLEGDIYMPPNDTISYLVYDKSIQYYKIGRLEKLKDNSVPGNLIKLHKKAGLASGEGLMQLVPNLKTLRHIASGTVDHNINTNSIMLKVALGIDFVIPDGALDVMIEDIDNDKKSKPVDISQAHIKKRFEEMFGVKYAKKVLEKISRGGYSVSEKLERSFLFSDIKLKWNSKTNSYNSVGKIGINNIKDQLVNKYVTGNIKVEHSGRGDVVTMYFKIDRNWYFFTFAHDVMRTVSSNSAYNEVFSNMKNKDLRYKTQFGNYSIQLSSASAKNRFVRQFMQFNEPENDEEDQDDDDDE